MVVRAAVVAAGIILLGSSVAAAQSTTFSGLRACERMAVVQFKRHDPGFKRFVIERASVSNDKYSSMVGSQFVSTIYHGKATYEAAAGPKKVRFICLHGGVGRGPVFVYTLPE